MNVYLAIKTLHIVSSAVLVGTGFGTAFYLFCANRTRSVPGIALVSRLVVRADCWFTSPAVVIQPVSGLWLAHAAGWTWQTPWIIAAVCLYLLAGACWLPVVWLQLRMAMIASGANQAGMPALPQQYWRYARYWEWLGYPAFAAMLIVYGLMVFKPSL
ncbi:DUF2269 domain-containing protein [Burkholderia sp. Ax-1724]|uniref:DUF2269 family protein n=1 Tax=Burkholderia sp. Ax-1724 TaxID=2608336 RepID=UPI001422329E|nr:DUF2269 domain-containing protein [Burkholderia sp. Ax-1724]NIF55095.1 DUF2269 domain-containing protein [Burkholderia sp. Ax-1724]